ncbi:MAG: ChbG/HpnK family deacetylase, partial [Lachnospiraceae bacterium]|nr:ChbG/HpnK family deacetylase [Lachnospiraceae bacterium]
TLWHIDSHHHVHTDPSVYRVLRKVIRDYPVTSVRLTRNMFRGGNPLMRIYKTFFNMSVRRLCDGDPRYFGSAQDYEEYIKYRPDIAKDHEVEVMVHPVYDSAQNLCDISHGVYRKLERLH